MFFLVEWKITIYWTLIITQKHLAVYLDGKLDFPEPFQNMFKKVNKTIVYYVNYKISYLELH